MARRNSYKPELIKQAYNYALLGATDTEIAKFLGIARSTLANWKNRYPEFKQALDQGKEQADAEVAQKLFTRAIGYTYTEKKTTKKKVGDKTSIEITETEKLVIPDVTAQIFWLKNRQKNKWRDTWKLEHTGNIELENEYLKQVQGIITPEKN